MTEPISTRNLDRYGSAELPWSRPRDILVSDTCGRPTQRRQITATA